MFIICLYYALLENFLELKFRVDVEFVVQIILQNRKIIL